MARLADELFEVAGRWSTADMLLRGALPEDSILALARIATAATFPDAADALARWTRGPVWSRVLRGDRDVQDPQIEMSILEAGVPVPAAAHPAEWANRVARKFLFEVRAAVRDEVHRHFGMQPEPLDAFLHAVPSPVPLIEAPSPAATMRPYEVSVVVEHAVEHAGDVYRRGHADIAYRMLRDLVPFLRLQPRAIAAPMRAHLYQFFGSVQMQRGERGGPLGAIAFARRSRALFRRLGNRVGTAQAVQLLGLCARQEDAFEDAIRLYREALETAAGIRALRAHIEHDLAVSEFLLANTSGRDDYDDPARLLRTTNDLFRDVEPHFWHIGAIRQAELALRRGELAAAQLQLEPYTDPDAFSHLTAPFRAIFLRVAAESHLAAAAVPRAQNRRAETEQALQLIDAALRLDLEHHFRHQLRELGKLGERYGGAALERVRRVADLLDNP